MSYLSELLFWTELIGFVGFLLFAVFARGTAMRYSSGVLLIGFANHLLMTYLEDLFYTIRLGLSDGELYMHRLGVAIANKFGSWVHNDRQQIVMAAAVILAVLAVLDALYRAIKEILPKTSKVSFTYQPERMVPGSDFQLKAEMPPFQCELHGSVDGAKYHAMGQAFWVKEGLLTAAHVINDITFVILKRGTVEVQINKEDFICMDGDIALYKITSSQTQKLGLSQAKLSPQAVVAKGGLMVQVAAFGKRSFGFLAEYDQFGYCSYVGSTEKGFSGAPYYMNKTVYGMHLGSVVENLGYEASYIKSLLTPAKTIRRDMPGFVKEDSEEWIIEQAEKSGHFDYDRSPYDPDEYRVKIHGRYHVVDENVLGRMLSASKRKGREHWNTGDIQYDFESNPITNLMGEPVMGVEIGRDVMQAPPAEELPLAPRGAMNFSDQGNLIRAPAVNAGARGQEMDQAAAPQLGQPQSSRMVYESRTPLAPFPMAYQTSMPAQPSAVSKSTARNKKMKLENQRLRSNVEQLSRRLEAMESGRLIYQQPIPSTSGLNESSAPHSVNLTTTAPQGTAH